MADLLEIMKQRYSVRDYDPRQVEPEKLARVLEAGRIAPTAKNIQPWRVRVLQSPEALEKIRGLTRCAFNAPLVLMVTVEEAEEWHNAFEPEIRAGEVDAAIVGTHMMLEAAALGLGTCWVGYFPPTKTREAFALPEGERPVFLMPLGYPAAGAAPSDRHEKRRPLMELVQFI